jgi:hypothetical protein
MPYGRNMNDAVLLPNGQIIIVNGAKVTVRQRSVSAVAAAAPYGQGIETQFRLMVARVQALVGF